MTHRLIMLGAPGSGKGTQATRIAAHLGIPTISTGQLFRDHMEARTELGTLAASYIDGGNLVPDDITVQMVVGRLSSDDVNNGFILDGFPRTISQAEALEALLGDNGVTAVVELWVDAKEVVERLVARARTESRSDDSPEVIQHRLEVYRESTRPLHDFYAERHLLHEVNAIGEIDEITQRILAVLEG